MKHSDLDIFFNKVNHVLIRDLIGADKNGLNIQ